MPANVETFVSNRVPAWHKLGTITDGAMTADEAGDLARLNEWKVRKELISTESGLIVPKQYATVRDHPDFGPGVLGIVGDRYQVVQNEVAFETLDLLVGESGAHFETAGSLRGGAKVFMTLAMPDHIQIAGQDAVNLYLLASNSHDGSSSFVVAVTPIRVVCQNTLIAAIRGARQSWSIRHTESVQGRIQEAREALQLTYKYVESFEEEMERLLDITVTDAEWEAFSRSLVPDSKSESAGWQKRAEDARRDLSGLFYDAATQEFGRGTAYAAYNAAVEYADWVKPIRGADPEGTKRAERILTSPTIQNFKDRALVLAGRL